MVQQMDGQTKRLLAESYERIMVQQMDGQTKRLLAESYICSTFQLGDNKI